MAWGQEGWVRGVGGLLWLVWGGLKGMLSQGHLSGGCRGGHQMALLSHSLSFVLSLPRVVLENLGPWWAYALSPGGPVPRLGSVPELWPQGGLPAPACGQP